MQHRRHLAVAALFGALALLFLTTLAAGKIIAFKKNMLQGATSKPSLRSWTTQSTEHCAQACAGLPECRSFSVQSDLQVCSLYSSRITALDIRPIINSELTTFYIMDRTGRCPLDKGYSVIQGTQKCAKLEKTLLNWAQAQAKCESEGGQLLIIEDLNTWSAVRAYLEDATETTTGIFIGSFRYSTGQYLWLDGTAVKDDLWHPGEPLGQECLSLWWSDRSYSFHLVDDVDCGYEFSSVCEM